MSSVRIRRDTTQPVFLLPSFRYPPTKPPMSLIRSCWSFDIFIYSACVSGVSRDFESLESSTDHGMSWFFHDVSYLLFPSEICSLSLYLTCTLWSVIFATLIA